MMDWREVVVPLMGRYGWRADWVVKGPCYLFKDGDQILLYTSTTGERRAWYVRRQGKRQGGEGYRDAADVVLRNATLQTRAGAGTADRNVLAARWVTTEGRRVEVAIIHRAGPVVLGRTAAVLTEQTDARLLSFVWDAVADTSCPLAVLADAALDADPESYLREVGGAATA